MFPVLFTIPGTHIPIHSYGTMLGIAMVLGFFLTKHLAKNTILFPKSNQLIIASALSALVGARLLAIITTWSSLDLSNPLTLLIPGHTGLVAYGGFLGGVAGAYLYTKIHKLPLLTFADAASPALALGLGIVRIGCFLYGCDYGRPIPERAPTWLKNIGVQFPNWATHFSNDEAFRHHPALAKGAPAFWHHVHDGLITTDALHSLLVFPAQLLASLNGFIAFALLLIFRKRTQYPGQLFFLFVVYYGITRILIEFVRGDSGRGVLLSLTTSQWIGFLTIIAAIFMHHKIKKQSTAI